MKIIGIDPGIKGGFCLLSEQGEIERLDSMPLGPGGKICPMEIAKLYRSYREHLMFDEAPMVYVEKLYTMPTDDSSKQNVERLKSALSGVLLGISANVPNQVLGDAVEAEIGRKLNYKGDGRKGLLSYAKSAGYLYMAAAFGWVIVEVSPTVWCRKIKQDVDRSLSTKDQSEVVCRRYWSEHFERDAELCFYTSSRAKKPCDGLLEAALIAKYGLITNG